MTTAALNETVTVRDLVFGGLPVEPTDALTQSLRGMQTLARGGRSTRSIR
jgi:hypothetical protein